MCAIFGSVDFEEYKSLYNLNLQRGTAAFGGLYANKDHTQIFKAPGVMDLLSDRVPNNAAIVMSNPGNFDPYFAGHTQAPTSAAQQFSSETCHPFILNQWVVAHNGVLTNFEALKQDMYPKHYNIVDSSIIPALLNTGRVKFKSEVGLILNVLQQLKGTYSVWLYNIKTDNFYIARCGSTLFLRDNSNTFSSVCAPGMREVEDGSLYYKNNTKLEKVGQFVSNSPFFIL